MELMIRHSEILTIMIQAFFITTAGFIFIGCWDELILDIRRSRKLLRKRGGEKLLREYTCPKCGYSAWALDHIVDTNCHRCGAPVTTKPVPAAEGSFVCNEKTGKGGRLVTEE
ncbi:MAG: hypothetical protein SA378_08795 [Sedimentibacter sp.]|uniref:hypothetical protein n=1 Tax=Sedimentibacter sp. TaxID=1960295 RepID=UPI002982AC50|nr:hypothetical protein [Sedimentibacter sp.]MDW5300219.1 hypothetical protein [Sedimentibacter sp.]